LKKILVLPNPVKPIAIELAGKLVQLFQDRGIDLVLESEIAQKLGYPQLGQAEPGLWDVVELVLVLGGDGSMLNAARRIYPRQIPLLGVNLGHLGFLTRIESHKLEEAFEQLFNGHYQLEERSMLQAEVVRDQLSIQTLVGLNDLVVAKSAFARIRLETWIDEEYFTTYPGDGLIIATATGSTAYSLSAGGPILDPRLEAILLTPICAHALYARPMVLSPKARVKVVVEANHTNISLTVDGQAGLALQPGDEIHFKKASGITRLLKFNGQGLFAVLKSRLKEGRI
jgi:NAD+ kinase